MSLQNFKLDESKKLQTCIVYSKSKSLKQLELEVNGIAFTNIAVDTYGKWTLGINLDKESETKVKEIQPFEKYAKEGWQVRDIIRASGDFSSIYLKFKTVMDETLQFAADCRKFTGPGDLVDVKGKKVKVTISVMAYFDNVGKKCGLYFVPEVLV